VHQIENFLAESLQKRKDLALYRILKTTENMVDFCSNDYLGFAKTGILVEGIKQELAQLEQSHNQWVGATGSRLLAGNYAYTENLESTIADFHGAEAGLIFNSGYDANVGVLASVPQKETFDY
jgi:8-amino-7-oxononanoate synthase